MKILSSCKDEELIVLYREGNVHAFEVLACRHRRRLLAHIYKVIQDYTLAEDLLQDIYLKIIHSVKGGKYNEQGKFLQWALRLAHNMCIDHLRNKKKQACYHTSYWVDENHPDLVEESHEDKLAVLQNSQVFINLLNQLSAEQRDVMINRHYNDMSFKPFSSGNNS